MELNVMPNFKKFKKGDIITFKAATRWGCNKATRVVVGVCIYTGRPMVRYGGWSNFEVYPREVLAITRNPKKKATA